MNITFIGNRLQDIGYNNTELHTSIISSINTILKEYKDSKTKVQVYTSLSPGVELWAAEEAWKLRLPFTVIVPFDNFQAKWPLRTRQLYTQMCKYAAKVEKINSGGFEPSKLHDKDVKLITESDIIYTYFLNNDSHLFNLIKGLDKEFIDGIPRNDSEFITL